MPNNLYFDSVFPFLSVNLFLSPLNPDWDSDGPIEYGYGSKTQLISKEFYIIGT
jgi:hypothetical protein